VLNHIPDFESARPHMLSMDRAEGEKAAEAKQKLADGLVWMEEQGVELPRDFREFMEKYRTK